MSVSQVLRGVGQWSLKLAKDAPPGVLEAVDFLGHIAIVPGRINAAERGDELLSLARYVGILRDVDRSEQISLSGVGMAAWLGDEDGKGDVIEAPGVTLTGATFAASIAALLPAGGAVTAGTLTAVAGTYTGTHTYQTPRTAISYVCDLFDAQWRVNGDGTLDAGPASALFRTTPEAMIVRQGAGYDHTLKALPGDLETKQSAKDTTTRVVVVGNGLASGSADVVSTPYRDIHGNDAVITRVVDEQDDTAGANAAARAQAVLNLFSGTRRQLRLRVDEFDVAGDFEPGDTVWVYDPAAGVADPAFEVTFRGQTINPVPVRVLGLTWPISAGHSVGFRSSTGVWTDLTPWVAWESGGGEVEVADSLSPALTAGIGTIGTVVAGGGGGAGDASIPGVPTFGTFTTSAYQPGDGVAQAQIKAVWTQPLNTDASTIVDGDHYEIRYRPTGATEWAVTYAGWDQLSVSIIGLNPSTTYEFQIRAVDYASPINYGAWSSTTSFLSATDTTPPATPAPPTVAASLIAVQVTHTLGLASGGTYNLPLDMDHFDVHIGTSSGFTPSAATLAGKLTANGSMVTGTIPAVGTFATDPFVAAGAAAHVKVVAVDRTGNASAASSAANATADLIDSAYISDLTASKITAGTVSSALLLSGSIKTGTSGARVELDTAGVRLYNSGGTATVDLNTGTGTATLTGKVQTGTTGSRVVVDPATTDVQFYPSSGSAVAKIAGVGVDLDGSGPATSLAWLDARSSPGTSNSYANMLLSCSTGTDRARAMLAARQVDNHTSAYVDLMDRADDSQKYARIGVGSEAGAGLASLTLSRDIVTMSDNSGSSLQLYSANAALSASGAGNARLQNGSGSYLSASGNNAIANAAAGGNAAIQTGSGNYVSVNDAGALGAGCYISAPTIYIGDPSGNDVRSDAIYNNTATFTANMGIATAPIGRIYRLTSSARYKVEITPTALTLPGLAALEPVTYYDRGQAEAQDGSTDGLSQQLGLIAEQVHAIPGLGHLLVELDEDGRPESVNYDRVGVALIPWLRDLAARLAALEAGA